MTQNERLSDGVTKNIIYGTTLRYTGRDPLIPSVHERRVIVARTRVLSIHKIQKVNARSKKSCCPKLVARQVPHRKMELYDVTMERQENRGVSKDM